MRNEYDEAVKVAIKTRHNDEDIKAIIKAYNNSEYKLYRDAFKRSKQSIIEKLRKVGNK